MLIYNYHSIYQHFTGESPADESPLEPGVWLIPAYATNIKPPKCEKNQIQVFNGNSWQIIEDQRGIYYSVETQEILENSNPLEAPEGFTKETPPEVSEGKVLKWDNEWILEDIPPPPELTPLEKLTNAGLTVDELKQLLGLTP